MNEGRLWRTWVMLRGVLDVLQAAMLKSLPFDALASNQDGVAASVVDCPSSGFLGHLAAWPYRRAAAIALRPATVPDPWLGPEHRRTAPMLTDAATVRVVSASVP